MTHFKSISDEKIDYQLAITLVVLFFIHFINIVAKSILPIPISMWDLISNIGYIFGAILVLLVLPSAIKRYPLVFIVSEAVGIFLYCISLIQNQNNISIILDRAFWTLGICIPMGYLAYSVFDKQIMYDVMLKASYYMTALISLVFFFNWFRSPGTYSMSFSYSLLYPLLFHLDAYFNKRKIIYLFLSLYQMTLILLYGSRGAVLCFSVFIIIKIVFAIKSTLKKAALIGFGGILVAFFYMNFEVVGNSVLRFLAQNGYYSRTLNRFFYGSIMQSSGRDRIWANTMEMITEKPWIGWGVGGDAVYFGGTYPHNIFLEILLNFGIIIGGIICVVIIMYVIHLIFLKESIDKNLLFIYFCAGFLPLLLSSTYLKDYEFFIFMFLCVQASSSNFLNKNYRTSHKLGIFKDIDINLINLKEQI